MVRDKSSWSWRLLPMRISWWIRSFNGPGQKNKSNKISSMIDEINTFHVSLVLCSVTQVSNCSTDNTIYGHPSVGVSWTTLQIISAPYQCPLKHKHLERHWTQRVLPMFSSSSLVASFHDKSHHTTMVYGREKFQVKHPTANTLGTSGWPLQLHHFEVEKSWNLAPKSPKSDFYSGFCLLVYQRGIPDRNGFPPWRQFVYLTYNFPLYHNNFIT